MLAHSELKVSEMHHLLQTAATVVFLLHGFIPTKSFSIFLCSFNLFDATLSDA
jgi:hypothetical protein